MQNLNSTPVRAVVRAEDLAIFIPVASFVIAVALIVWPVLKNNGFPLDDSWIHQVVGQHAAEFGIPGFMPGVASSGSSSAIWPWIIAINYLAFPSLSHPLYLLILNSLFMALILVVLYRTAQRDKLPTLECVALASLPVLYGNFVWLIATGMEHLLLIACLFLAAHFLFSDRTLAGVPHTVMCGLCFAVAVATRPEAVALLPVFMVGGYLATRRWRPLIGIVVPCVVAVIFVMLNNYLTSRSFLPVTVSGRKWLYFHGEAPLRPAIVLGFIRSALLQITGSFVDFKSGKLLAVFRLGLSIVFTLLAVFGVRRLLRVRAYHTLFLIVLAVTYLGVYFFLFPAIGTGMRYQAMVLLFVFPLMAFGLLEIGRTISVRKKWPAGSEKHYSFLAILALFALASGTLREWSTITDEGIQHINGTHVRMGKWLDANVPNDQVVAAFDIGGIGFYSGKKIADLGGLVDPAFIPYLFAGRTADYLKEKGIHWVVMPTNAPEPGSASDECRDFVQLLNLCDRRGFTKTEVKAFYSPHDLWEDGWNATGHAFEGQTLYKIDWQ
ncbi:hypothetical protein AWB79_02323 [Caballeronia hypogeia]|uniref:Glycosyltransferase RgtA/B/C/D-like domain-containing protein n=1 Tax=Caballeronia hypogeia TaxID=1777140 RepID=A0A158AFV2_9BURK|nr:hypothetical protein [Caballeronia hypogeia]SAK56585.1 hypothetical protein AWB79_02323 [Caballeronia hypogeia]